MKKLIFFLSITLTVSAIAQVPNYVPTNGLVGWWGFNGNANDESGNNLNGNVIGATLTPDRFGNLNSAYKFDYTNWSWGSGGDQIYIPFDPIFNSTALSVSVWVQRTSAGYPNQGHVIINRFQYGYSNPNGQTWGIGTGSDPNCNIVTKVIEAAPDNNQASLSHSGPILGLNDWSNIVLTFDGIEKKQYVNGVLIAIIPANGLTLNTAGNSGISVGVSDQANGHWGPLDGKVDDIGIWNRALTPCEISELYHAQQFTPPVLAVSDTTFACGSSTTIDAGTDPSWDTYSWNTSENSQIISVSNSGLYTVEVTDTNGCIGSDTTMVSLLQPTTSNITESSCDTYTAQDGQTYTSTGNYTAVIPNEVGCDSTITIDLTITNSNSSSETITECDTYTWVTNGQTYTQSGQYTEVLTNQDGCDSTVTLDLTINTVDNGITQVDDFTLQANQTGASYQWIDCTDGSIVVGATSQQFAPTENGEYAVVVTQNGCSDTTACLNVVSLNLLDNDKPILTVYPNPAKETITISSDVSIVGKDFSIINQLGQAVILGKIVQQEMSVDLSDLSTGVYVIRIDGIEKSSFRIVKE